MAGEGSDGYASGSDASTYSDMPSLESSSGSDYEDEPLHPAPSLRRFPPSSFGPHQPAPLTLTPWAQPQHNPNHNHPTSLPTHNPLHELSLDPLAQLAPSSGRVSILSALRLGPRQLAGHSTGELGSPTNELACNANPDLESVTFPTVTIEGGLLEECSICLDDVAEQTHFPCGHWTCPSCSCRLYSCPFCRRTLRTSPPPPPEYLDPQRLWELFDHELWEVFGPNASVSGLRDGRWELHDLPGTGEPTGLAHHSGSHTAPGPDTPRPS
uniref:RING-type domain-containing protein n=1 Tax=Eutreptiella gymnastica TaxID=73025 RepID=A0A7S1JI26_9EUGL|mmetsp:Transcript_98291/g.169365  ORF Transcript_98291/g.169365 Transcript_98291/m.169365 type:complete len:269 (+) Transcript_98291:180-986(+)